MSKNKNGTFKFLKDGKEYPTLLTKAIFRDVEKNIPELLLGRLNHNEVYEGVVERVSSMLYPEDAKTIFEVNGGKNTVKTYLQHLSNLGEYDNGLSNANEGVIDMYLTYKKEK